MSYIVKQYPGESDPPETPIALLAQHGSFGEAQIDVFGRAARWADEKPLGERRVTAPMDDQGLASTAILWEGGKVSCVLTAEVVEATS